MEYIACLQPIMLRIGLSVLAGGGSYELGPTTVNGGGTRSTGGTYAITASTAQVGGVGIIVSSSYKLQDGFWHSAILFGVDCRNDPHCDDGQFCNGVEQCVNNVCVPGVPPCASEFLGCCEDSDSCDACDMSCVCNDGVACTVDECSSGVCSFTKVNCTGACCFDNGTCVDETTITSCSDFGGEYLGHELTCDGDPDGDSCIGCDDGCPHDPDKCDPGECGCSVPERVLCPCGVPETDGDNDGVPDCIDLCVATPTVTVDCYGCPFEGACCSQSGASCFDDFDQLGCDGISGVFLGNGTLCSNGCDSFGPMPAPTVGDDTCFGGDNPGAPCSSHDDCPNGLCGSKSRYTSWRPPTSSLPLGFEYSFRVTLEDLPAFSASNGETRWVGNPREVPDGGSGSNFWTAQIDCDQVCTDWVAVDLVHPYGAALVPGSVYKVQAIGCNCDPLVEENYSAPLFIATGKWGDVVAPFGGSAQPNFGDITALVDKFKDAPGAVIVPRGDLTPHIPDQVVNFADITFGVDAFKGIPYPHGGPETCVGSRLIDGSFGAKSVISHAR